MIKFENVKLADGRRRRKILGIMGLGTLGLIIMNSLPFKIISRRSSRVHGAKSRVTLNELAVKRNKKVI